MALTKVTSGMVNPDPSDASNLSSGDVPLARLDNVDTSGIIANQDDIALLGFKVAANGSLAKYNLIDQTIDAFEDASGVDASASTGENFDAAGFCFAGTETATQGNWSAPVVSDLEGNAVLVDWGTCYCTDNNPADECGVCGGYGFVQSCGCGLEYNCELQPGACDCTGRLPSATYNDGSFICSDESEVCDVTQCSDEPSGCEAEVCLSLDVDLEASTLDIYMTNSEPVGGFQFELFGITISDISI